MKNYRRKLWLLISLVFIFSAGYSQEGDFFLTHHAPGNDQIDNANFDMAQDRDGVVCIANRSGLLQFDGRSWNVVNTPGTIFTISIDSENDTYAGGTSGFGVIRRNADFNLQYFQLSDSLDDAQNIFDSRIYESKVYLLSPERIFVLDAASDSLLWELESDVNDPFQGLIEMNQRIVASTYENNYFEIGSGQLSAYTPNVPDSVEILFAVVSPDNTRQLTGTSDNQLFFMNENSFLKFDVKDDGYMADSDIIDAVWIDDELIAVATLKGGVIFFDVPSGEVHEIVNYHTGLPDNEIFAILRDKDEGVWVSHDFGFTRISPNLPFRSFSNFPGLEGNLFTSQWFNDRLYVGTSLGVFYLDQVEDYKDVIYFVRKAPPQPTEKKVPKRRTRRKDRVAEESTDTETKKDKGRTRKGFLGFLGKKKRKKAEESEAAEEQPEERKGLFRKRSQEPAEEESVPELERKIRRELQSVRFVYKKVEGIDTKVEFLQSFRDKLLVGSLDGTYEISGNDVLVISEQPVQYLYVSRFNPRIFISTVDEELFVFDHDDEEWIESDQFLEVSGFVQHIFEDTERNLWLVGDNTIFKTNELPTGGIIYETFELSNPYYERTIGLNVQGKPYFVNSNGYFTPVDGEEKLQKDEILENLYRLPERYILSPNGVLWIHNGEKWFGLGDVIYDQDQFNILKLFHDIHSLNINVEDNFIWVTTADNNVYKILTDQIDSYNSSYELLLKEIRDPEKKIIPTSTFRIEQEKSSLTFEFIQPDFSGILGIEYQFKLNGLSAYWSEWSSNNNLINFPYLPPGSYRLEVRTRNALGQINEIEPIAFNVVPPYWRQWWFYALEVFVFGTLLILSFRLNRISTRYKILSRLLAFLTLILIVEFIQTIASFWFQTERSPVIDFLIQVSIALLALPFESRLRGMMFKNQQIKD